MSSYLFAKDVNQAIKAEIANDSYFDGIRPEVTEHIQNVVVKSITLVAKHMDNWTKRSDDAKRIPDVLREYSDQMIKWRASFND